MVNLMSKFSKILKPEEIDVLRRYHKRGCSNFVRCKIDQINLDLNTSRGHRLAIIKRCKKAIERDEHFLTEAVPNDNPKRRIDFVSLTLDMEEEFETDKKVKKSGAKTTYVDK